MLTLFAQMRTWRWKSEKVRERRERLLIREF
jgi:hypothetical protein